MNPTATALRQAADLIEDHPDLPQPYVTTLPSGRGAEADWFLSRRNLDERATAATIITTLGGHWDKGTATYAGDLSTFTQHRGPLTLHISVTRDAVCERIVTGTKQHTIPAVPAQPERVETVETVEWRCQPLLTTDTTAAATVTVLEVAR